MTTLTQRDLVSAMLKVLGVGLVILGVLAAGREGIVAIRAHRALVKFPEPYLSANVPADLRRQIMSEGQTARDVQKYTLRLQRSSSLQSLAWALVQAAIGYALARHGGWVVRFTCPGGQPEQQA